MKVQNIALAVFMTLFVAACGQKQVIESDSYLGADALDTPPLEEAENPGDMAAAPDEEPAEETLSAAFDPSEEGTEYIGEEAEDEIAEISNEPFEEGEATDQFDAEVAQFEEENFGNEAEDTQSETNELNEGEEDALDQEAAATVAEVDASSETEPLVAEPVDSTKLVKFSPSKNPVIRSRAFEMNGEQVNRYYFVRPGDTAESLSTLFYGDENQSAELEAINGEFSSWKPGMALYYRASNAPDDETVKSFYEDQNVTSEAYTIEKGDTLSQIAEQLFGNSNNWSELSIANEMTNPDRIFTGSVLFVYPNQLAEYAFKKQIEVSQNTQILAKEADDLLENKPSIDFVSGYAPESKAPMIAKITPKPVKQASVGIAGFLEQNLMLLLISLGLIIAGFLGYQLFREKTPDKF